MPYIGHLMLIAAYYSIILCLCEVYMIVCVGLYRRALLHVALSIIGNNPTACSVHQSLKHV